MFFEKEREIIHCYDLMKLLDTFQLAMYFILAERTRSRSLALSPHTGSPLISRRFKSSRTLGVEMVFFIFAFSSMVRVLTTGPRDRSSFSRLSIVFIIWARSIISACRAKASG